MNQNPEQQARDHIEQLLTACGWIIQNKSSINLHAGIGIAVREYGTDIGRADYVLFGDKKPVGLIEAKRNKEAFISAFIPKEDKLIIKPNEESLV